MLKRERLGRGSNGRWGSDEAGANPHGARGARWDVPTLAGKAGLTPEAVAALERGLSAEPSAREAVRYALEQAGLAFIPEDETGGPGLRLRRSGFRDEGLRPEQLNAENDG